MKRPIFQVIIAILGGCASLSAVASAKVTTYTPQTLTDVTAEVNFLINSGSFVLSKPSGGEVDPSQPFVKYGTRYPKSYYVPIPENSTAPEYWSDYVCGDTSASNCSVTDTGNSDGGITTNNSTGGQLQIERIDTTYGTNIDDGSLWQMALDVAAVNQNPAATGNNFYQLANNETQRLALISSRAAETSPSTPRVFYGPESTLLHRVYLPLFAFPFHELGRNHFEEDPLFETNKGNLIHEVNVPSNRVGEVSWQDERAVTGNAVWATFYGPLVNALDESKQQGLAYIPYYTSNHQTAVTPVLEQALGLLHTLYDMQTPIGAILYAPTIGPNTYHRGAGANPNFTGDVSIANNLSTLAGLRIFKQVLTATLAKDPNLQAGHDFHGGRARLQAAIAMINHMIFGTGYGTYPIPSMISQPGLLHFLTTDAYNKQSNEFYTSGTVSSTQQGTTFSPTTTATAVDAQVIALTVLGPGELDRLYGAGTAYKIWQNVMQNGTFIKQENGKPVVLGVDYVITDPNSKNPSGRDVLSGDWTAEAINAARVLAQYYYSNSGIYSQLVSDEQTMTQGLLAMRNDHYLSAGFPDGLDPQKGDNYIGLPVGQLAFLYASKREGLPFGKGYTLSWYANPLDSTATTAWAVFLYYHFNPYDPLSATPYGTIQWWNEVPPAGTNYQGMSMESYDMMVTPLELTGSGEKDMTQQLWYKTSTSLDGPWFLAASPEVPEYAPIDGIAYVPSNATGVKWTVNGVTSTFANNGKNTCSLDSTNVVSMINYEKIGVSGYSVGELPDCLGLYNRMPGSNFNVIGLKKESPEDVVTVSYQGLPKNTAVEVPMVLATTQPTVVDFYSPSGDSVNMTVTLTDHGLNGAVGSCTLAYNANPGGDPIYTITNHTGDKTTCQLDNIDGVQTLDINVGSEPLMVQHHFNIVYSSAVAKATLSYQPLGDTKLNWLGNNIPQLPNSTSPLTLSGNGNDVTSLNAMVSEGGSFILSIIPNTQGTGLPTAECSFLVSADKANPTFYKVIGDKGDLCNFVETNSMNSPVLMQSVYRGGN